MRSETTFRCLINDVADFGKKYDINLDQPTRFRRRASIPTRFKDSVIITTTIGQRDRGDQQSFKSNEDKFRQELFYSLIDSILVELTDRFGDENILLASVQLFIRTIKIFWILNNSNHQHLILQSTSINSITNSIPGRSFRPPDTAGTCRKNAGKRPYPAGKHRKSAEHGSSIPAGNFSDFFPMFSGRFLLERTGIRWNLPEKSPKNFRPEYCYQVPLISGVFLREPARTLRPGF